MGDARLYYYPDTAGTLFTIDFTNSSAPDVRVEWLDTQTELSERADGRVFTSFLTGRVRVRIRAEGAFSAEQQRLVKQFRSHAKRGGFFGFTLDSDKAWGSSVLSPANQGTLSTQVTGQSWYEPTTSIGTSDTIIFETPAPEFIFDEVSPAGTITNSTINITHGALGYTFAQGVHVRWRDFWPILYLEPGAYGQAIFTSEGGSGDLQWTLDLSCIYDVQASLQVVESGGVLQVGAAAGDGDSVQDIINGADGSDDGLPDKFNPFGAG